MEISRKVHTVLKCFVDMNLETNEKFPYDVQLLSVSFDSASYAIDENNTVSISISLEQPSLQGIEEADLILSHITTDSIDIDGSELPLRLKWNVGEQTKVVNIPVLRDFLQEGNESFLLGLTNLCNLKSGEFVQTRVIVVDTTELRTVRILSARPNAFGASLDDPNATILSSYIDGGRRGTDAVLKNTTTFTLIEGDQISMVIGLDRPSQFGVERVELSISSGLDISGLEYQSSIILSSNMLAWEIGEQYKTVTINTGRDSIIQGDRRMILELKNPYAVKFGDEEGRVEVIIQDPPIARRYASIDFGRIFKQRGSDITPSNNAQGSTIHLKCIPDGQITNQSSIYWLTEMGTSYIDENNNPDLNESSNYAQWPNYYFGVNERGTPQGVYLRVTNRGIGNIMYGEQTYAPGQSFLVTLSRGSATITLPTNDLLQPEGSFVPSDNSLLTENTFTECKYQFDVVIDIPQFQAINENRVYGPHGFILKTDSDESLTYLLGEFTLANYNTAQESIDNPLGLYSSYSNMRTRYDGSSCSIDYEGYGKVHDVMIHGLILLSENSLGSDRIDHNILPMYDRSPICGANSGNSNGLSWISIPFEII